MTAEVMRCKWGYEDIVIPDKIERSGKYYSVISIGKKAFTGSSVVRCKLGNLISNIDTEAFYNCMSLEEIEFGASIRLENIGKETFKDCNSLRYFSVSNENPLYSSQGGIIYNKDFTEIKLTPVAIREIELCKSLTEISERAFYNCGMIQKIDIPERVTSIGEYAFYNCSSLKAVELPEGVSSIGKYAFYGCSSLTEITLPEGLTEIPANTFYNCNSLQGVELPERLTSIGDLAFCYCSSLTEITLPKGLTSIGEKAFYGCSSLTEITFPEGLTSIGDRAFSQCTELKDFVLPNSLVNIGDYAFPGCRISSLYIPENVVSIGRGAFSGCSFLRRIEIAGKIEDLEYYLFYSCSSLEEIILPSTLKTVKYEAFTLCSSLKSIYIPASVEKINFAAFSGCRSLTDIEVDPENPFFCSTGPTVFNKDHTELVAWPTACGDVVIPDGITTLPQYCFYNFEDYHKDGFYNISILTLPSSVKEIGSDSFFNLMLKQVYCYAETPPTAGANVLRYYEDYLETRPVPCQIYVPSGSLALYESTYPWSQYTLLPMKEENGVETLPEEGESVETDSYTVFSIDGRLLLKEAEKSDLKNLSPGIYIINGRKVAL